MTDTTIEENVLPEAPKRSLRPDWIMPVIFRPKRTLREIVTAETANWLTPLLVLTLLAILLTLVAGPLRVQAALSTPPQIPTDFKYWSPDVQQKFIEANTPNTGRLVIYVLPGAQAVLSVWAGWFILGAILHLVLTFSGGRGSRAADFNLAAWSALPIALRMLVQIAALLLTNQLILHPGLSGFFASDSTGFMAYLLAASRLVDLYWIWQIVLLVVGVVAGSRMSGGKALGAVLISVLIFLALAALPGFAISQIAGLTVQRPYLF